MIWRTTALAMLATSAVLGGETKWTYSRLIDAPLAPVDRPAPVKILKVSADPGPAADGDVQHALATVPSDEPRSANVMKTSGEKPAKLTPDAAVDPLSKAPMQTWRVFVGGEVARPGAFNAQRPFTALQAVIAAGGVKEQGKSTEIVVLRYQHQDAPPTPHRVDLSASLAGKGTNDLWLETHDVVIVPKAGSSTSTDELLKGLPIPVATAAKNKLVEIHRVKADAADLKAPAPILPAK